MDELATVSNMFSPPRREKARDDSHLPKGDCRYIMLHPEVKGLRCACVGFALNSSIPGSTCNCGHQACYHSPKEENASVGQHELEILRRELEAQKEKVNMLEHALNRERHGGGGGLVDRLGRLEEMFDRTKADHETEFKSIHGRFKGAWENIIALNQRSHQYDDHIEGLVDNTQRIEDNVRRIDTRLNEVDEASIRLEERVDDLERERTPVQSPISRRRRASTPPSVALDLSDSHVKSEEPEFALTVGRPRQIHTPTAEDASQIERFRERVASVGSGAQSWTVHISLLPTSSQPFPFEKDTAAYKRCLSRGLHQIIVIPDTDSKSFVTAVDTAFSAHLRGRHWEPLTARLCDAKHLRGLPMLRQLDRSLIGSDYDSSFLQKNCAVCDDFGKILDLYIAMSDDTISWAELKEVAPYKQGLEESWIYDALLDSDAGTLEKRPAAGDIVQTWSPTLKRNASEISRTSSFSSSADAEAIRAKIRRQGTGSAVEVVGRRAEAV